MQKFHNKSENKSQEKLINKKISIFKLEAHKNIFKL